MLLKKLKLDTEKFDLVIASLGKGKIFERFPDDFKANDFNPKVWVLAYQVPKLEEDQDLVELNFFFKSHKHVTKTKTKILQIDQVD